MAGVSPAELVPLPADFYNRSPLEVAPALLGQYLVRAWRGHHWRARIVEAEAYLGENDPAAHAWRGPTPRNRVLFGPPGRAYVYFIYGLHYCLNVSAEPRGQAGCVLIRAAEAVGPEWRARLAAFPHPARHKLLSGPGRLARELHIGLGLNGCDLTRPGRLWLAAAPVPDDQREPVSIGPRTGIRRARDLPARFYLAHSPAISGASAPR